MAVDYANNDDLVLQEIKLASPRMSIRASLSMMMSYFLEMLKKQTLYFNDPSSLLASKVFGTIVVLLLGVVCMLSQHKDSSFGDFSPKTLIECMAVEKHHWQQLPCMACGDAPHVHVLFTPNSPFQRLLKTSVKKPPHKHVIAWIRCVHELPIGVVLMSPST